MEKYLDNNGTKLWSFAKGSGTPLILCNGGLGCDDYLAPVSEMIEDLCTVVRFEQRGCGRSDWDKRYEFDTTLNDIDFVREAYGFDKVIIAGHSAGVNLSLVYALRQPEAVLGIVGISGGCIVNDRKWSQVYHDNLEKFGEDHGGLEFTADPDVNKISNATWRDFITNPTFLLDISRLNIPAVFINAGGDIRPNWPTVQIANLLKNGKYVEIPRAGHYIWLAHPNELRRELRTALQSFITQPTRHAARQVRRQLR
ncbi:alpha/beta hydrolase [candidate division KSB1 bacterium]|nr:alpha/beta hydrolase [candidate division KSB1 bacterium]